ncbi:hypothetical protein ANO14919_070050 [Xylariales sp. No.14919]|nr:hypothetical protein ANO14919_070050 [Xylariales sp. No.14919]
MSSSTTTYRITKHSPEFLPVELVSKIMTHLGPHDILSLRLTSRALESKVSLRDFTPLFTYKAIELDQRRLETMEYVISHSNLGRLLQHCTLIAVLPGDGTCTRPNFDEYVPLLTKLFLSIKQHCPGGKLPSLCLNVDVGPKTPTEWLFEGVALRVKRDKARTAAELFKVTMAALHESQLSIEQLDLFSNVLECGLALSAFLKLTPQFASTPVFSSLKEFGGKFSLHPWEREEAISEGAPPPSGCNQDHVIKLLRALLKMSAFAPELESLYILWYANGEDSRDEPKVQIREGDISKFKCLKECSLHGLMIPEQDLLRFMKAVRPTTWTITDSFLSHGTWASIHGYLTSADSPVTYYHLDANYERVSANPGFWYPPYQVHYNMPGEPKIEYRDKKMAGPYTLTRHGSKAKEEIRYEALRVERKHVEEFRRWNNDKRLEYGPNTDYSFRY